MKIYDRLQHQFPEGQVEDALLLVEISDPNQKVTIEEGPGIEREVPETIVLSESTTDRLVVQVGIMDFAHKLMYPSGYDEEEEDDDDD